MTAVRTKATERNAEQVHAFSLEMGNLGLSRVTDLLMCMFESSVWRDFADVGQQIPQRPGRDIEPFGYAVAEARHLGIEDAQRREALGRGPRQWNRTGGATTKRPSETVPCAERIARSLTRLDDEELDLIIAAASEERARRFKP